MAAVIITLYYLDRSGKLDKIEAAFRRDKKVMPIAENSSVAATVEEDNND